jgi:hypothetical protein
VGNDSGARLELFFEDGFKRQVGGRQQVERDDRRLGEVDFVQVPLDDTGAVFEAKLLDALGGFIGESGVQLDADGFGAEILGRGDDDAAVSYV